VFTTAIGIALSRGLEMSCGCFASQGAAEDPISWLTILRDLGWLSLALYVLFVDREPIGIDRMLGRRPGAVRPATTEVTR
jgi:putative oxidoreductase